MRVIVLAAGEGTRLRPLTLDRPKCLVPLLGRPLLDWQLRALRGAGLDDITVVTGYRADQIEALGLPTVSNPDYGSTNMVASLMCARDLLDGRDDVLIAYSDIVYERPILDALLASSAPVSIAIDHNWRSLWEARMPDPLADAETMRIDPSGLVQELGRKPSSYADIEGQYMGLITIKADAAPGIVRAFDALDPNGSYDGNDRKNMYMTSFLQHLIDHVLPVKAVPVQGGWLEVDSLDDLQNYERLADAGRLSALCDLEAAV